MPFRSPFRDDQISRFDMALLAIMLVVIAVLVAWGVGLL
jgi:hypothetical protein